MYHQADSLNFYLETVRTAWISVIGSGMESLSPYVYARQCDVKALRSNGLAITGHEHL
jgi:hypothetical protein